MDQARSADTGHRTRRIAAALIVLALSVVAAFSIGRLSAPVSADPVTTSNEAGFARDMQVHHAQAVEMSLIVRDATDDESVRLLAYDIATTQAQQGGQMYGWLAEWNLPQADAEPSMTWMTRPALNAASSHSHDATSADHDPGGAMPGYATSEEMTRLRGLTGVEAEKDFLTLMIAHHTGGVEMAEAILERSSDDVVTDFARGVVAGQSAEITVMQEMLAARA